MYSPLGPRPLGNNYIPKDDTDSGTTTTELSEVKKAKTLLMKGGVNNQFIIAFLKHLIYEDELAATQLEAKIEDFVGVISRFEGLVPGLKPVEENMKKQLQSLVSQLEQLKKNMKTFLIEITQIESNGLNNSSTIEGFVDVASLLQNKVHQIDEEASELFKSIMNSMSLGMGQGELGTPLPTPPTSIRS